MIKVPGTLATDTRRARSGRPRRHLAAALLASAAAFMFALPAQAEGGFVYTANEGDSSVSAIDLATGAVTTVDIPIAPHNVQISPDGSRLLAVGNPAAGGDHAHAVEEDDHAEADDHADNGDDHGGMDMGGEPAGLLVVLDPENLEAGPLASVPVGDHLAHVVLAADGGRAFVADSEADVVAVADLAAGRVVERIATGRYPHGLRLSPDGRELYVATVEEGAVSVIDTDSLAEVARIPVGAAPVQVGFTPDGARVYVSLRDENAVAVIDTATRAVIGKIAVGSNPIQVYATPDGSEVYVANQGTEAAPADTVSVIDVATGSVVGTVTTGPGAHGVVVSDDGTRVFVTNIGADSVSEIDTTSMAVTRTFAVGDRPNGITYRAAGD